MFRILLDSGESPSCQGLSSFGFNTSTSIKKGNKVLRLEKSFLLHRGDGTGSIL